MSRISSICLIFSALLAWVEPAIGASDVEIIRTPGGIPHIRADSEGGLGFGLGYAYAQDNFCLLAEETVTLRGERSRYFGPDEINGPDASSRVISSKNLESDFFFKRMLPDAEIEAGWRAQPADARERISGYVKGFNRYLTEMGIANLPDACRGKVWVRPISYKDIMRLIRRYAISASSARFIDGVTNAAPPGVRRPAQLGMNFPDISEFDERNARMGSNGVALGRDATVSGSGLLLANPHFPWNGLMRFYEFHLTMPGELDVMGAALPGLPVVNIGFNKDLAWTHTVSRSRSFAVFALELDPEDPTVYRVNGKSERMQRHHISVDLLRPDGSRDRVTRTFWTSRYGPIILLPGKLEWTHARAYALYDANTRNDRQVQTWMAMDRARNLDELLQAEKQNLGIPWVNTIATDKDGKTLFSGVSVVVNIPQNMLQSCIDQAYQPLTVARIYVLRGDGSCDIPADPRAVQAGIMSGDRLPVLFRNDYVQNSNDSAWLSNPAEPMTGYPAVASEESYPQGGRTRIGLRQIGARLNGSDGLPGNRFDATNLLAIAFSNVSAHWSLVQSDILTICRIEAKPGSDLSSGCSALSRWDGRASLGSVGYPLASELFEEIQSQVGLWRRAFDPEDPIHTPSGLRYEDETVRKGVVAAMLRAIKRLTEGGIDYTKPLRELQVHRLNTGDVPIPGGNGGDVYNAVNPTMQDGRLVVEHGSSYVQVVDYATGVPVATGLLAYSESTDPSSPHYEDQTERFSKGEWMRRPFLYEDIIAEAQGPAQYFHY